jgi:hypothetical protein
MPSKTPPHRSIVFTEATLSTAQTAGTRSRPSTRAWSSIRPTRPGGQPTPTCGRPDAVTRVAGPQHVVAATVPQYDPAEHANWMSLDVADESLDHVEFNDTQEVGHQCGS